MFRKKISISPLLLRLLTLNILVLFFLLGGFISIDRYEQTLVENEYNKLEDEGRILAQAIGRSIAITGDYRTQIIITREAQITISHPRLLAQETPETIPRSLKLRVGFMPSCLSFKLPKVGNTFDTS